MDKFKIGDVVVFIDEDGKYHNALVIHVWPSCLNLAYVDVSAGDKTAEADNFGNSIIKKTSVPFKQPGMSAFYVDVFPIQY